MNEEQFTNEILKSCSVILPALFFQNIDKKYIDNIHFEFHDDAYKWVAYYGTKLTDYDKKAVATIGKIIRSICNRNRIFFVNATSTM